MVGFCEHGYGPTSTTGSFLTCYVTIENIRYTTYQNQMLALYYKEAS